MSSSTINLKPLDQDQKRSIDHLKGDHFEEATENSLYAYVKQAESATDAPQVQPRARASERSDWIF